MDNPACSGREMVLQLRRAGFGLTTLGEMGVYRGTTGFLRKELPIISAGRHSDEAIPPPNYPWGPGGEGDAQDDERLEPSTHQEPSGTQFGGISYLAYSSRSHRPLAPKNLKGLEPLSP